MSTFPRLFKMFVEYDFMTIQSNLQSSCVIFTTMTTFLHPRNCFELFPHPIILQAVIRQQTVSQLYQTENWDISTTAIAGSAGSVTCLHRVIPMVTGALVCFTRQSQMELKKKKKRKK